ncbi:hypothetical protein P1J78_16235 [Psychromarinibacter sp. C21-152]|uniref:Uncharacterized protein n=1 Tax=Psychromarinibacter sediminicola TaxID=3033385 RepID=A0AAE3TB46_9RHOB|nr:hypothetical protein [Psychromarinibacter sediminicola]MDF0602290.1 hypothetical protein [Psychromarinibacter sediminicola]
MSIFTASDTALKPCVFDLTGISEGLTPYTTLIIYPVRTGQAGG